MAEYIEKEKAIGMAISNRIRTLPTTEDGEDWIRVKEVRESLQSIPAVDVAPVVHGRWREVEHGESGHLCECSACKEWMLFYYGFVANYCPVCGARMDLVTDCNQAKEATT